MRSRAEILKILEAIKPELGTEYNVKTIGIFGSVAREQAHSQSDIDVLVEFSQPIGLFKFLELEEALSQRLGGQVDLVSRKALKPEIGRVILAEAIMT